ncbi:MAG: hypothetical protein ACREKH_18260, partial [Candidatus Rokuibacteriota bacterium]
MRWIPAALLTALAAISASAAPIVDGARDAEYGAPLAVQTVETGFGDNASEMDAGYGVIASGRLYLML